MLKVKNELMQVYASNGQSSTINSLSQHVSYLCQHIAPVVDVANNIQGVQGDINLLQVPGSKNGCWHTTICINAQTKVFHTEEDCGYTVISVPKQKTNDVGKYHFLFMLKPKCYVGIKRNVNIS